MQQSALPSRLLTRWLPLGLLVVTILLIFNRLLFGDVLFWGLPSLQFYPWREFAVSEIAQGRLPLWNPYNGGGAPLLANYQSALLYPPHWLSLLWHSPQLLGLMDMAHLVWAGIGMILLARRWHLPLLGQGIAALSFPLSSTIVARAGTIPMLEAASWLPWLILACDALIDGTTWWRVAALAGVVAMQLLVGHAQWTFYSFVLAGGYTLWRIVVLPHPLAPSPQAERGNERQGKSIRGLVVIVLPMIAALALGVGIAAAQLLPTAELQRESQRSSGVDEAFALNFSYSPVSLLTLFNPNLFGNPGNSTYVIPGEYFETTAYIGALPLILALMAIYRYFRRGRGTFPGTYSALIPFFAIVAAISVVLAFGKYTPIYPLLYRYVPTFNLFQAPARWLLLTVFSLTALAALSTPVWRSERRATRRARIGIVIGAGVAGASLVLIVVLRSATPTTAQLLLGFLGIGILLCITFALIAAQPADNSRRLPRWTLAVLAFVAVDLLWANALSNPTVAASFYAPQTLLAPARIFWPDPTNQPLPDTAYKNFLALNDYQVAVNNQGLYRQSGLPDMNLLDRQPSLNNFDPLRPDGLERYTALLNKHQSPALLQAAGVGHVMDSSLPDTVPARDWMVSSVITVPDADAAAKALSDPAWTPDRTVVIESQTAIPSPGGTVGTTRIVSQSPQELTINTASSSSGFLVVADTYYPGWQATVDGKPADIYRANLAFRAVAVPQGEHTVKMIYQPRSLATGAVVSGVALLLFAAVIVVGLVRRTRRQE